MDRDAFVMRASEIGLLRNLYYSSRFGGYRAVSASRSGFDLQARLLPVDRLDRLITVDTASIQAYTSPHHWRRKQHSYILRGDWDESERYDLDGYYRVSRNYRSTYQIYAEGRPYQESDQYQYHYRSLQNGGRHRRCSTIEELNNYFVRLDETFNAIRTNGYRTQAELGLATPTYRDEVKVFIDRNGELLKANSGNHRFAFARILGLPRLPVIIDGVHERWVQHCVEHYGGDLLASVQQGITSLEGNGGHRKRAA